MIIKLFPDNLTAGIQSIISLTVLALQRYMMVSQDRQFPLSTPLSTLVTLLFIWLYTAAVSVPPLMGWGEYNMNTLKVRSEWTDIVIKFTVYSLQFTVYSDILNLS